MRPYMPLLAALVLCVTASTGGAPLPSASVRRLDVLIAVYPRTSSRTGQLVLVGEALP